ncbi:MAG TPA: hypothetical protein VKA38_02500, partial [Draconibacterium sp.]|nr:hypothetical protein [Draconibacterium sp.]
MIRSFLIFLLILFSGCAGNQPKLKGPYLGQSVPGTLPELFAPGIVNTGIPARDITITPNGKEIYFGLNIGNSSYATIFYCKETESGWTAPEVLPFADDPRFIFIEPCISPDGQKLFFVTNKGNDFTDANQFITDIWVAERENDFWGEPYKLDTIINTEESEFYPTVSENSNLYFTRENPKTQHGFIYKSEFRNGKYQTPAKLPEQINAGVARFNATIARDESFIIVPIFGMPDSFGSTDYYVCFFDNKKGWSNPLNLVDKISTQSRLEYSANFSPDGYYFFFMSAQTKPQEKEKFTYKKFQEMHNLPENGNSNIYWMKANFINDLKEKATF